MKKTIGIFSSILVIVGLVGTMFVAGVFAHSGRTDKMVDIIVVQNQKGKGSVLVITIIQRQSQY